MRGDEILTFTEESIEIRGTDRFSLVMHRGEDPLMKKFADLGCRNCGNILEVGFGMGISANYIQENNIKSHTIIEIHPEIYKKAIEWAESKNNVNVILGSWESEIPKLTMKYDGILHDTHIDMNCHNFLNYVKPVCNENCIVAFAFYKNSNLVDIYDVEVFKFNEEDYQKLPKYPYENDPNFIKNHYEIRYTTYKEGKFGKRKVTDKKII